MVDLSVRLGGLRLANPVLTASGTFGYGLEYDELFDVAELGGICTKGLSLKPRLGNPHSSLHAIMIPVASPCTSIGRGAPRLSSTPR